MSQDWNESNQYREPDERFDGAPPEKKGMSGGMKVLLILLAIGGVCLLVCCGVGFYFAQQMGQSMSEDPVEIRARTKEMAEIEIPPPFEPVASMAVKIPFMFGMKFAIYQAAGAEGQVILMQIDMPMNQAQLNSEDQLDQMMRQQGQGNQARKLDITETEARQYTVNGQEVTFKFGKGTDRDTGDEFRQVVGAFPGKSGTVILMLQIEEAAWDEESVVQMLESLGEPVEADGAAPVGEAMDAEEPM